MNFFIPAIGKKEALFVQPQVYMTNDLNHNIIITGAVDDEIKQSVYISLSLLHKLNNTLPSYIHVHFPEYSYYKTGISASLGICFSLWQKIKMINLKYTYLMTGEIDLDGNIHEIGQIEEKIKAFNNSGLNYFIIPQISHSKALNKDRIFSASNISEIFDYIDYMESGDEIK